MADLEAYRSVIEGLRDQAQACKVRDCFQLWVWVWVCVCVCVCVCVREMETVCV